MPEEIKKENSESTEKKPTELYQEKPGGKFKEGNPGRPKGARNFSTLFKEALFKIAEERGLNPDEIETDLVVRAILEARGGNYNFYKDILDRIYGQAKQSWGFDEPITKLTIEIAQNGSKDKGDNNIPEESGTIPEERKEDNNQ